MSADLISRKALINILEDVEQDGLLKICQIIELLEDQPKAYEDAGWIPVEERLPEAGKKVLCYFAYEPDSPDVICDNRYIGSGMWESESDNVVAWMLRPEEYHPKRESKAWKENFLKKFNKRT